MGFCYFSSEIPRVTARKVSYRPATMSFKNFYHQYPLRWWWKWTKINIVCYKAWRVFECVSPHQPATDLLYEIHTSRLVHSNHNMYRFCVFLVDRFYFIILSYYLFSHGILLRFSLLWREFSEPQPLSAIKKDPVVLTFHTHLRLRLKFEFSAILLGI